MKSTTTTLSANGTTMSSDKRFEFDEKPKMNAVDFMQQIRTIRT